MQNKYKVICRPDEGRTGRFEINFYKNEEDLKLESNGLLLHSKKETGKYPDYGTDSKLMK